ncbi:MAG: hypothetical protein ACI4XW_03585 [Candidatus Spyradocola sp.]
MDEHSSSDAPPNVHPAKLYMTGGAPASPPPPQIEAQKKAEPSEGFHHFTKKQGVSQAEAS